MAWKAPSRGAKGCLGIYWWTGIGEAELWCSLLKFNQSSGADTVAANVGGLWQAMDASCQGALRNTPWALIYALNPSKGSQLSRSCQIVESAIHSLKWLLHFQSLLSFVIKRNGRKSWQVLGDPCKEQASCMWDSQPSWFPIFSTENPISKEESSPRRTKTLGHLPCGLIDSGDLFKPSENTSQLKGLTWM